MFAYVFRRACVELNAHVFHQFCFESTQNLLCARTSASCTIWISIRIGTAFRDAASKSIVYQEGLGVYQRPLALASPPKPFFFQLEYFFDDRVCGRLALIPIIKFFN